MMFMKLKEFYQEIQDLFQFEFLVITDLDFYVSRFQYQKEAAQNFFDFDDRILRETPPRIFLKFFIPFL